MSRYIDIHTHRPTALHIEPQVVGIHPWMAEKEAFDEAIFDNAVAIGEIGLTGEIRSVSHMSQRLGEVSRLGFKKCIIPRQNIKNLPKGEFKDIEVIGVRNVREAFECAVDNI